MIYKNQELSFQMNSRYPYYPDLGGSQVANYGDTEESQAPINTYFEYPQQFYTYEPQDGEVNFGSYCHKNTFSNQPTEQTSGKGTALMLPAARKRL